MIAAMQFIIGSLCVLWLGIPPFHATPMPDSSGDVDIKMTSNQLVQDLRTLVARAKNGIAVRSMYQDLFQLQTRASDLFLQLPGQVSECDVNLVIKMAATGSGSHETLTLLLADNPPAVLSGRMSLSLAFLDRVAQLLEDQLAVSTDVGPHLAAVVFGTNATSSVAMTADHALTSVAFTAKASNDNNNKNNNKKKNKKNNRRNKDNDNDNDTEDVADVHLGSGWTVGSEGQLQWQSFVGKAVFSLTPSVALSENAKNEPESREKRRAATDAPTERSVKLSVRVGWIEVSVTFTISY